MKKVLALILAFIILMPQVYADEGSAEKLREVLIKVKEKINVPEELTEFEGNHSEYKGKVTYSFDWHDKKYEDSINVTADEKGRILHYNSYVSNMSEKKLTGISKREIIAFADSFLQKTLPELYGDSTDVLVLNEKSYNAGSGSLRYSFSYDRHKNGVIVHRNNVNISVGIDGNESLFVRSMSANIDYEATFAEKSKDAENLVEKYKEAFPMELVYKNEYNPDWKVKGENRVIPFLIYRNKDNKVGYILAETGEIAEEDSLNEEIFREESATDSVMGSVSKNEALTEKELEEIGAVSGLMSREEIENYLKELPHLLFPDDMVIESSHLSKNDEGKYIYRFYYKNKDEEKFSHMSVAADAKDGKLISYNYGAKSYSEENKPLSEQEKAVADKKTEEFLKKAAGEDFKNTVLSESIDNKGYVDYYYYRIVNSVKHIDNGIRVGFDAKSGAVTGYSIDFTSGKFADPSGAIGEGAAYEKVLSYSPVVRKFVKTGGCYKECVTLDKSVVTVDALSGEIRNKIENENLSFIYDDIKDHWAEEAATKLAEIQIGFGGGKLSPDKVITQEELFRLMLSGIYGKYYQTYTTEDIYESLIRDKVITEEEKAPDAPVKREDAAVYMVRIMGLEKVAKLKDIYKVNFEDAALLSEEKLGHCAILSGMGIICGNGGYLRPQDSLTRAEAIAMLYKYLLTI